MEIRESQAKDWKVIQLLNNEVFIHDEEFDKDIDLNWPFSDAGTEYYKELAGGTYGKCYVAEEDGKAVGYIALGFKDWGYRTGKHVELENMGVLPEYRSKGIGRLLVDKAKEWARSVNATKLYVSAYWGNTGARNFYEREGFEPIDQGLEIGL
ncbi:MAG: GNAT family N-acetyltransferase [Candidatus Dojkabacteria bacterium]|jgi:GNAT superfamily N-acetyltransferase|nr:GNAT family N-acetyltransferase [Candidatus Dojkabacteria bacterium]